MMKTKAILTHEDTYNLLTGRIPMLLSRFLSYNLKREALELTREQWSILITLWKEDGCSQQTLADLTYRDKPSTTRLIDNLEKDGYVVRRAHATDRRQNLIFLTEKSKKINQRLADVLELTMQKATEGLNSEQIDTIRNVFDIIYNNIKHAM